MKWYRYVIGAALVLAGQGVGAAQAEDTGASDETETMEQSSDGTRSSGSFADRAPRLSPEEIEERQEEAVEAEEEREPMTMAERLEEAERQIRFLTRMVDPYNHRDEMRLERRLRDLERTVEEQEREIRRLSSEVRR